MIGKPGSRSLAGRNVLVVEDEFLIADDLAAVLRGAGAEVIGPAASLPSAIRLAGDSQRIDAAVLDIHLDGVTVFPLADELRTRNVPMLFLTGYGDDYIPDNYSAVLRCDKPIGAAHVVERLKSLVSLVAA
ncbi:MAG: response regulator [Pseudomonadota bacterium]|nr:response regulator [Pseudomonadota bacterium]